MRVIGIGGSMRPFIRSGTVLEVNSKQQIEIKQKRNGKGNLIVQSLNRSVADLNRGDVVLYKKGDQYFIHRTFIHLSRRIFLMN